MNKAEEFRMKTAMYLVDLSVAAEEFCNEMLLTFEEHEVKMGLYESSFTADDVPDNLRPHIEKLIVPIFKEKGFYVYGVDNTTLFGGKYRVYHVNWRGEENERSE